MKFLLFASNPENACQLNLWFKHGLSPKEDDFGGDNVQNPVVQQSIRNKPPAKQNKYRKQNEFWVQPSKQ